MTQPQLDVVIVAYGNRDSIAHCVHEARRLPSVGEVVVVDHGTDGSGDVARGAGAAVVFDPTNPGFGAGQNRGVELTRAPFVLLLNPDAAPEPCGVAASVEVLRRDPKAAAAQGVIMNRVTGAPERSQGAELTPVHLLGRALGARRLLSASLVRRTARRLSILSDHIDRIPSHASAVESLAATAFVVRRVAFDAIGGFDPSYFLYGEDLDLCRRFRVAQWELVAVPEVSAWHDSGGSSASTAERELAWWRGTMRFAAQWWGTAAWNLALLAAGIEWLRIAVARPRVARRAWFALVMHPLADRRRR